MHLKLTFPTEGNPMSATLASPDFSTSNPSPFSDFFDGSNNWALYLASLAFSTPKWYSVAETYVFMIMVNVKRTMQIRERVITFIFLSTRNFLLYFRDFLQNTHFTADDNVRSELYEDEHRCKYTKEGYYPNHVDCIFGDSMSSLCVPIFRKENFSTSFSKKIYGNPNLHGTKIPNVKYTNGKVGAYASNNSKCTTVECFLLDNFEVLYCLFQFNANRIEEKYVYSILHT